jgi:hypothetical protein
MLQYASGAAYITHRSIFLIFLSCSVAFIGAAAAILVVHLRKRGLDRWLGTYYLERGQRLSSTDEPVHVLLCIADHYEPHNGHVSKEQATTRVQTWIQNYPLLFAAFRDSDGKPPQHSFFFPIEQYDPTHIDDLALLCKAGFGEIEFHLHHDNDNAISLRKQLLDFKQIFHERHGLLPRDRRTGDLKYGFIHGNWALDNSRPDGRWCGVNNELDVLRETGCYADFTMPSCPSPTQTRKINSIYYAVDAPCEPKSHDWGTNVGTGIVPDNALLLIQGPLLLNWSHRKWGIIPRIENGGLQRNQLPSLARLDLWLKARVQIPARPDWLFVKLHTHGAPEANQQVLLGKPMTDFHEGLRRRAIEDANFHYHYVTAREMYNLVKAAESGWTGSVADARDFELVL